MPLRYLITGTTGLIGSNLFNLIRAKEPKALIYGTGLSINTELSNYEEHKRHDHFTPLFLSIIPTEERKYPRYYNGTREKTIKYWKDARSLKDYKPDVLIHLAANTDPQDLDESHMSNINFQMAWELMKYSHDNGTKRIVYASSCAVYGDGQAPFHEEQELKPLTPYAKSKADLDTFIRNHNFPALGLRFSNVYGQNERHKGKSASMIYQMCKDMKQGIRPRLFRDGEQRRDFINVSDVCQAIYSATKTNYKGVMNIGSGKSVSFNEIHRTINQVNNSSLEVDWIDNPYEGKYQSFTQADITRAKEVLCWKPRISLEEGIGRLLDSLC